MKNFAFLAGLPRSGSTLLCAILDQNPKIHAEGNSAMCQLMWDISVSLHEGDCRESIEANKRYHTVHDVLSGIPDLYYKNIEQNIIVDKCRSWPIEFNIELIEKYITQTPKYIILVRPIEQIVASLVKIRMENNFQGDLIGDLLEPGTEPLMRSLTATINAKMKNRPDQFLFVHYDDLSKRTEQTVRRIYDFFGWEYYEHDFVNVEKKFIQDDSVYNTFGLGLHDIRSEVKPRKVNVALPDEVIQKCEYLNSLFLY